MRAIRRIALAMACALTVKLAAAAPLTPERTLHIYIVDASILRDNRNAVHKYLTTAWRKMANGDGRNSSSARLRALLISTSPKKIRGDKARLVNAPLPEAISQIDEFVDKAFRVLPKDDWDGFIDLSNVLTHSQNSLNRILDEFAEDHDERGVRNASYAIAVHLIGNDLRFNPANTRKPIHLDKVDIPKSCFSGHGLAAVVGQWEKTRREPSPISLSLTVFSVSFAKDTMDTKTAISVGSALYGGNERIGPPVIFRDTTRCITDIAPVSVPPIPQNRSGIDNCTGSSNVEHSAVTIEFDELRCVSIDTDEAQDVLERRQQIVEGATNHDHRPNSPPTGGWNATTLADPGSVSANPSMGGGGKHGGPTVGAGAPSSSPSGAQVAAAPSQPPANPTPPSAPPSTPTAAPDSPYLSVPVPRPGPSSTPTTDADTPSHVIPTTPMTPFPSSGSASRPSPLAEPFQDSNGRSRESQVASALDPTTPSKPPLVKNLPGAMDAKRPSFPPAVDPRPIDVAPTDTSVTPARAEPTVDAVFRQRGDLTGRLLIEASITSSSPEVNGEALKIVAVPLGAAGEARTNEAFPLGGNTGSGRRPRGSYLLALEVTRPLRCQLDDTMLLRLTVGGQSVKNDSRGEYRIRLHNICNMKPDILLPFGQMVL